jgi:hypothetical protein
MSLNRHQLILRRDDALAVSIPREEIAGVPYHFNDIRRLTGQWCQAVGIQLDRNRDDELTYLRERPGDTVIIDADIIQDFNTKFFTTSSTQDYIRSLRNYFNTLNGEVYPGHALNYMYELQEPSRQITEAILQHFKLCRTNIGLTELSSSLLEFIGDSSRDNAFQIIVPYYNLILLAVPFCIYQGALSPELIMVTPLETVCTNLMQMSNEVQGFQLSRVLRFQNYAENTFGLSNYSIFNDSLNLATRLGIQWGCRNRYITLGLLNLVRPAINLALTGTETPVVNPIVVQQSPNVEYEQVVEQCWRILVNFLTID